MSHLLNSTKFPLTAPSMGLMRSRKKRLKKLFAKSVAFYRSSCRCLGSYGFAAMQGAAPVALIRRSLARRTFTSLGAAPLAGPAWAKPPWNTLFEVGVCHAEISTSYGVLLYLNLGSLARGTCLGPRTAA